MAAEPSWGLLREGSSSSRQRAMEPPVYEPMAAAAQEANGFVSRDSDGLIEAIRSGEVEVPTLMECEKFQAWRDRVGWGPSQIKDAAEAQAAMAVQSRREVWRDVMVLFHGPQAVDAWTEDLEISSAAAGAAEAQSAAAAATDASQARFSGGPLGSSADPPLVTVVGRRAATGEQACAKCGRTQAGPWVHLSVEGGILAEVCRCCYLLHQVAGLLRDPSLPASTAGTARAALEKVYLLLYMSAIERATLRAEVERSEQNDDQRSEP